MTETTTPLTVGYPAEEPLTLRITLGPCRLSVVPGATGWVQGTYRDPSGKIPILVEQDAGTVRIRQSADVESVLGLFQGAPALDLEVGTDRPFALVLEGGGNEIDLDLGGLPLVELEIRHGAGKIDLDFDAPNPVEMSRLRFATGAGSLEATHLANANFAELIAEGGAAKFELDFGGDLRRSATARVSTGAAGVEITLPSRTAAKVAARTTLGSINVGAGFTTHDGGYWTTPAETGATPVLDVDANVAVGTLKLSTA